ncbi:conserved exported protein of unknown function [Microbacterium sp. Nx66]|nr:conserved exported protein of unknown function [Microbacterium sp. Nx66]
MRLLAAVVAIALSMPGFIAPLSSGCNAAVSFVTGCSTTGNRLTIVAAEKRSTPNAPSHEPPRSPAVPEAESKACRTDTVLSRSCGMYAVRVTEESGRPLTIEDVAQFAPAPVTTTAEPGNVGVVGMPTNFVATVAAHTATGTLLDRPVTVRFTPVRVVFDHGDGTTAVTPDGGRTWSTLGQAPFTPTETSHTYTRRGTYSTRTTVAYTAQVDVGGGWFAVPGELSIEGASQDIRIYEATTALVARTCEERPAAVGC